MAGRSKSLVPIEQIDGMIHTIRGVRVMFDRDLAEIYGVPTFRFNEAIKRNPESFRGSQVERRTATLLQFCAGDTPASTAVERMRTQVGKLGATLRFWWRYGF